MYLTSIVFLALASLDIFSISLGLICRSVPGRGNCETFLNLMLILSVLPLYRKNGKSMRNHRKNVWRYFSLFFIGTNAKNPLDVQIFFNIERIFYAILSNSAPSRRAARRTSGKKFLLSAPQSTGRSFRCSCAPHCCAPARLPAKHLLR